MKTRLLLPFLVLAALLFGCKTLYLFTDIEPGNSIVIGGEGSASFTVKIRNTSKYRIEVVKSGGTIDETPFILQSKENVVIDVPENTELILKNKNDAAVHVNVGVETSDKMVRAIGRPL